MKSRAALLTEVSNGRHTGTNATLDDLFAEWIIELRREGRSPNTVCGYEKVYKRNIHPTPGTKPVPPYMRRRIFRRILGCRSCRPR